MRGEEGNRKSFSISLVYCGAWPSVTLSLLCNVVHVFGNVTSCHCVASDIKASTAGPYLSWSRQRKLGLQIYVRAAGYICASGNTGNLAEGHGQSCEECTPHLFTQSLSAAHLRQCFSNWNSQIIGDPQIGTWCSARYQVLDHILVALRVNVWWSNMSLSYAILRWRKLYPFHVTMYLPTGMPGGTLLYKKSLGDSD